MQTTQPWRTFSPVPPLQLHTPCRRRRDHSLTPRVSGVGAGVESFDGKKLCGKRGFIVLSNNNIINLIPKNNIISWANEVQGPGNEILNGETKSDHIWRITELQYCFFLIWPTINLVSKKNNKNNKLSGVTSQKWKIPHEKNAEHAVSNYGMRRPLLRPHVSLSKRPSNHGHQSNHKYNQFFSNGLSEFSRIQESLSFVDNPRCIGYNPIWSSQNRINILLKVCFPISDTSISWPIITCQLYHLSPYYWLLNLW